MKFKAVAVALALVAGTSATAQIANSCGPYVGQTVAAQSFDQAIASLKPVAPKGEFETTAAYEERVAAAGRAGKLIITKNIENPSYLTYDADAGALTVKSYAFDNMNFEPWSVFYHSKFTGISASTINNHDVLISSSTKTTGSYQGQNAYGAKATIERATETVRGIFESEARYNERELFTAQKGYQPEIGKISMTPAEAQAFKPQAKVAFVVQPVLPYVVRSKYLANEATIRNPVEKTVDATVLLADIQCGLLLDGQNKVVGAYETR